MASDMATSRRALKGELVLVLEALGENADHLEDEATDLFALADEKETEAEALDKATREGKSFPEGPDTNGLRQDAKVLAATGQQLLEVQAEAALSSHAEDKASVFDRHGHRL